MSRSAGVPAGSESPRSSHPVGVVVSTVLSTWANRITTVRVAGTAGLCVWAVATLVGSPAAGWQLAAIIVATCCEILDGVDGKVARARGEASAFGASYDMETDSVMLLALSFALIGTGAAGWWVLILGGWRYAYWLGQRVFPVLRTPLPYLWSRRLVAVLAISTAIAGLFGDLIALPQPLITGVLVAGAALLSWSFGRDIVSQLRARAAGVSR